MALNLTAAYPVTEPSQAGEARRAAAAHAARLGFAEERAGRAALVASELATNLAKHARGGELLLRALYAVDGEPEGLEILAIDRGPGMPDVSLSRTDGHSTAGTLGHGLGAIARQSDFFQIYTQPSGTIALGRLWRAGAPSLSGRHEIGAVQVSAPGEDVCGDQWDSRAREDRLAVIVADGLGHGMSAHEAAREATAVFRRRHESQPAELIADIHSGLRSTRGAAVSVLAIDTRKGVARYAGVGNISAVILHPDGTRQGLVGQNGTAGHIVPRIQEYLYPVSPGCLVVLHSDGLGSHWDLAAYPGLGTRDPSIVAAVLYRDFSRRRDDVTVVVVRDRPPAGGGSPVAEKL